MDKEMIVTALRCVVNRTDCNECSYYICDNLQFYCDHLRLDCDAADLIEAQAAEIERLTAERDALDNALRDMVVQYCSYDGKLDHEFMSAGEHAFDVLDLDYGAPVETLWRGAQGEE